MREVRIVDGEVVTGDGQQQQQQEKTMTGQLESSSARDATGRELDALVAEKVMGFRWRTPRSMTEPILEDPHETPCALRRDDGELRDSDRLPDYSTDIAAAMAALAQVGGYVSLVRMKPDEWHVAIWPNGDRAARKLTWWAETLPLAICRALLAISSPGRSTGETAP